MAFEVETVTEIEALLGTGDDDDWDFEAIEMAARRMAMRVAARAVEQRLNDDTSDHAGPTLPCACGQSARYADRHGKNFESVLGSLRLERAYYYCELCECVPVRKEELVDRPGKQPDGSSKTREVKLVTIWSAEGRDKKGTPVRDLGSTSYSAAIESAAHKDTDLTPSARPPGAASTARRARPCSAMEPGGSGTSPTSTFPTRFS